MPAEGEAHCCLELPEVLRALGTRIAVDPPKLTQLPTCRKGLTWTRKCQFAPEDTHQVQATQQSLQLLTGCTGICSASLLCWQLRPAPAPEALPLQPTGARPQWTSLLMGHLGSQDTDLEET